MVPTDEWKEFLSPAPVGLVVAADAAYVNVGPGTWIQKLSYDPPIVMVSRKLGSDTDRLLSRHQPFVIAIPPLGYQEDVLACSQRLPYGVSELTLPSVRFQIASREDDLVFLEPMLLHAVCRPFYPHDLEGQSSLVVGDHAVHFAEVIELRPGTMRHHPHNQMLHWKTKVFAAVGAFEPCKGW